MRISVIGLGAVGGALAALLDRAGHDVTAIARSRTAELIASEGLILTGARGDHTARLRVADTPPADAELVLVAVRTYATREALVSHAAATANKPVLLLQNGLEGPQRAAELLGRVDGAGIFAGLALFPSTRIANNRVRLTGLGGMRVGHAHPAEGDAAAAIARAMNDAVPSVSIPNMHGALWSKLLVNHVNALPAITGTSVQAVCRHPLLHSILADALTDAVRVGDATRVRFGGVGVIEPAHVARIRAGHALEVVTGRLATAFGYVPNPASTLQSIRRGQPTEIDDLDGAVVRAAASVRMRAPIHEAMVALVHEVSRTGEFLTASEVARRVDPWRTDRLLNSTDAGPHSDGRRVDARHDE
ncbi:ketopantoate reductase family protein [Gulosibacter molinativorax]|uniref:2-dehydropantoate 2-reductase n=1 Tax=Gulosibacter molinativorax TaxID=256821 RepID=A0ABT7C3L7_9MICO|nr:2-dehydropantoate 2-reductase [Gulosibacter molinativorax]MDJ1369848.1 ketopantoate reductase family protein [Gulosibacter molinativorax]QUY61813.1 2-dehydropantoate 2-reductase [Gulosibacter molinativorax]